jgi:fluoride exporter
MKHARLYLYIAVGGVVGALGRHAAGEWVTGVAGQDFPWGTLLVNVMGSLLLGILVRMLPGTMISAESRALLTIGLCGGFTTFSTFAFESAELLNRGAVLTARLYIAATLFLGLIAAAAGHWAGGGLIRTPPADQSP